MQKLSPQVGVVSNKKPPTSVSSARQRRRRNKQEGGGGGGRGRVVLKSRSAANLSRKEMGLATPPDNRNGVDEPDYCAPPEREGEVPVEKREQNSEQLQREEDDGGVGLPSAREETHCADVASDVKEEQQEEEKSYPKVENDCSERNDGAVPSLNGCSSDEVEVDEFFTLLDTTLHLPDSPLSPAPFDSDDHPGPPATAFSAEQQVLEYKGHQRTLPPGRLADRIKALRE